MRGRAHRAWLLLPAGPGLLAGIDAGPLLLGPPPWVPLVVPHTALLVRS